MPAPPTCPDCHGTGFQIRPGEDGVDRARPCRCRDVRREERLLAAARIPRRYEDCSFESFAPLNEKLKRAAHLARRFVKEFPVEDGGLLFTGPCGTGKTHLAVAILRALLVERGVRGLFYDFQDLLKEIQSSYSPVNQTTEMRILSPVFTAEVLVLDDLGAQKPTAWVRDTIGHIVNNRYNARRTTLFTTNRRNPREGETRSAGDLAEPTLLDQIGARLHSRLYEMCHIVEFEGEDFRKTNRNPGLNTLMTGPPASGIR